MKTYLFASLLLSTFNLPNTAAATDPVPVVAPSAKPFHLTVVRQKQPMLIQVLVSKPQPGDVWLTLKDPRGETLYRTSLPKKQLGHSLVLNLNQLADGTYTREASGQGQVLSRIIHVQTPNERLLALR